MLLKTLQSFKQRGGIWFFSSSMIDRLFRFLLSFMLMAYLAKSQFGQWSYALVFVSTFAPIKSLGLESSIINGSASVDSKNINAFFRSNFYRAIAIAFGMSLMCIGVTLIIPTQFNEARHLIYILCLWLISSSAYELNLAYYRAKKDHKTYAKIQTFYTICFIVLASSAVYFSGTTALAWVFVSTPVLVLMSFRPAFLSAKSFDFNAYSFKKLISLGFKMSVSNYASLLLFYLDTFLISYLAENPDNILADYRTATLIPLNITYLASIYLTNDYVYLVENKTNKSYLLNYLKQYSILFLALLGSCILALYFGSDWIWTELFNGKYQDSAVYFNILLVGSVAIFLFRIPAGNMLSALDKVGFNVKIAYSALIFNAILSYFLFQSYQTAGIAYGSVISLALSGLVSYLYLLRHINNLPHSKEQ
ncbi:MAG: oligosaccharide flippase family protein [Flavobacteriales bacterium]